VQPNLQQPAGFEPPQIQIRVWCMLSNPTQSNSSHPPPPGVHQHVLPSLQLAQPTMQWHHPLLLCSSPASSFPRITLSSINTRRRQQHPFSSFRKFFSQPNINSSRYSPCTSLIKLQSTIQYLVKPSVPTYRRFHGSQPYYKARSTRPQGLAPKHNSKMAPGTCILHCTVSGSLQ
jgi:hypothetical protein